VSLGGADTAARVKLAEALLSSEGARDVSVPKVHLQEALAKDIRDHRAWFYLGVACQSTGEVEEAARCFQRSQALSVTAPVWPFSLRPACASVFQEFLGPTSPAFLTSMAAVLETAAKVACKL